MNKDMMLYVSCSESVCRIRVDKLDPTKKEQLFDLLKNRFGQDAEDSYDTSVFEETLFGIPMIVIDGDAPYNNYEEIEEVLNNFKIPKEWIQNEEK